MPDDPLGEELFDFLLKEGLEMKRDRIESRLDALGGTYFFVMLWGGSTARNF